jgi:hypothetical protein
MTYCLLAFSIASASIPWDEKDAESHNRMQRTVKDVVLAVAKNQLRSLADGKYKQGSWDEVRSIQGTSGVAWNYPWGVTL